MTMKELKSVLDKRQKLAREIEEITARMDALTQQVKDEMGEAEELTVGPYKVTWKYSKPAMVADVAKMKAAGIFEAFSKPNKPARPFKVI